MDPTRVGRGVLRLYLNLVGVPPSPATARLDVTRRAGAALDLAARLWRQGVLPYQAVRTYAELAAIPEADLRLGVLPVLEAEQVILVNRNASGDPVDVEEQVAVADPLLVQCSRVWEALHPSDLDRGAVISGDLLAHAPLSESDHRALLEKDGVAPGLHDRIFTVLRAIGVLRRERSRALNDDVLYSPYVWGSEAVDIATFFRHLPANEREAMLAVTRAIAERPGASVELVGGDPRLLESARKVGLIDATRVVTTGGTTKAFAFPPALERQMGLQAADTMHDRKLFTAHILFGHRFGFPGTGRVEDPLVLVRALLDRGRVGPATAIRTDYPLLEARGIVKVEPSGMRGRSYMMLVKRDVAEDALRLLEVAVGDAPVPAATDRPLDALWVPGVSYLTPEQDRKRLAEVEGAEAELMGSLVEQLRQETQRKMRGEDI